ncbi:Wzy polymerase domain-containing protein [Metapseudomonas furukawaii]|uniref:PglL family O-oligosaccharyltransferase n=1 Tax=Metapseudomonas furukawaii TaxID=1149133 RepID=UPI00227A4CE5|nr:Wzy polymerase domain-containing protein [Pseudomonas furukawaii]WAG79966.1 Wzy polymerase domain-containing protein [Pseudomonas furukawaii]
MKFLVGRITLVLAGVLMLVAWLVPNHYYPWLSAYNEFAAVVSVLLFFGVVALSEASSEANCTVFFCLVVALIPAFQYFSGVVWFFGDAFICISYVFMFGLSVFSGRAAVKIWRIERVFFIFCLIFLIGAVVSVFIALSQWLRLPVSIWVLELLPGSRPYANLGQPNILATLLALGVVAGFYLFEVKRLGALLGFVLIFLLAFGLVLTRSRTPWVAGVCVLVWWAFNRREIESEVSSSVVVGWFIFYWFLVFLYPYIGRFIFGEGVAVSEYAYNSQRVDIWGQMLVSIFKGGLLGYGWGQVGIAQLDVASNIPVGLRVEYSHNILIDLLVWNGPVLGCLIILVSVVWLLRQALLSRSKEDVYVFMMVGVILVHGLLEFPLSYFYILLPLGVLLGGVDKSSFLSLGIPRFLLFFIFLFSSAVWCLSWFEYRAAEEDNRNMRFLVNKFYGASKVSDTHEPFLFDNLSDFVRFARLDPARHVSERELEWAGRVAWRFPNASSLYRYAVMLAVSGNVCEAGKQLLLIQYLHGKDKYAEALDSMRVSQIDALRTVAKNRIEWCLH